MGNEVNEEKKDPDTQGLFYGCLWPAYCKTRIIGLNWVFFININFWPGQNGKKDTSLSPSWYWTLPSRNGPETTRKGFEWWKVTWFQTLDWGWPGHAVSQSLTLLKKTAQFSSFITQNIKDSHGQHHTRRQWGSPITTLTTRKHPLLFWAETLQPLQWFFFKFCHQSKTSCLLRWHNRSQWELMELHISHTDQNTSAKALSLRS